MDTVLVPAGSRRPLGARPRRGRRATGRGALVRRAARGGGRAPAPTARPTCATRGQSFELTVPLGPRLAERFHEAHEARYGYADRARALELVAVRTAEVRPAPPLSVTGGRRSRRAGPQVLELDGATRWVPAGLGGRDRRARDARPAESA